MRYKRVSRDWQYGRLTFGVLADRASVAGAAR
jgi:hypothetical protein